MIAAAATVAGASEVVVIGSQALLATVPVPPEELIVSMEADVFVDGDPAASDQIDGALGDGSPFFEAYGYYAHGVGPETAKAPAGWRDRATRLVLPPRGGIGGPITAICIEPHDLVLAKCAAGRDRDWEYAWAALRAGVVSLPRLLELADELPLEESGRARIIGLLQRPS